MITIHLIRHATNDFVETGRLAGRLPGVHLNVRGKLQAQLLAEDFAVQRVVALFSSPLERAVETLEPLASRLGLQIQVLDELQEIDIGAWAGEYYESLKADLEWQRFNLYRSGPAMPGQESMIDVQYRMVRAAGIIRDKYSEGEIVAVSHGDPIRSLLCWGMGIPLDLIQRIEVEPASRSTIVFGEWGPVVKALNVRSPGTP